MTLMLLVKILVALILTAPVGLLSERLKKTTPSVQLSKRSKKSQHSAPPPKRFEKIKLYIALGLVAVTTVLASFFIDVIDDRISTPNVK